MNAALLAAKNLKVDSLLRCFDPRFPLSRPNSKQQEIFSDIGKFQFRWVVAGNQCLASGTEVATPAGPVRIEDIQVGDTVYSEHGKPIQVLQTFQNGKKEVADLTIRGKKWNSSTGNHVFQIEDAYGKIKEVQADKMQRDDRVRRVSVKAPLGNVHVVEAYALGALLGDGCSRQGSSNLIYISSINNEIPNAVAECIGSTAAVRQHETNYTWKLQNKYIPYYKEWCDGRYAHEKMADLDVIKTWDRSSLLRFVAGVIDTDGSVYPAKDHVSINIGMQAESVIDAMEYAFLALWQIPLNRTTDARSKYKNGPIHIAYTRNVHFVREALSELDKYLISPQKKWRPEYALLGGKRSNPGKLGIKWGSNPRIEETYDIHVDSETNLYLLANGLVTHNSGKSATPAREIAWILNDNHPTWTRPVAWGTGPVTIIVAGQDRRMMELELWNNKLKPFLNPEDWREVRAGQSLQYCEHRTTGDIIVFISHADSSDKNRKHMQGYVAHYVWLDEMPASVKILEELQRRVDARQGYFIATFTPKFRNVQIKKIVDSCNPSIGKKYQMSKLDNPIFADRIQAELDKLDGYSEDMRNAILFGEWMAGDGLIYDYRPDEHGGSLPEHYNPFTWRHVAVTDPATESKLGLTVWAEDPTAEPVNCGRYSAKKRRPWYLVESRYVEGIYAPTLIIEAVESILANYRVILRIADSHEAWFIRQAANMPDSSLNRKWVGVEGKNVPGRKDLFIRESQELLGQLLFIPDHNNLIIDEVMSYERNPETGKIIGASRFHLIDCFHYVSSYLPEAVIYKDSQVTHQELLFNTFKRDELQEQQEKKTYQGYRKMSVLRPVEENEKAPCLPTVRRIRRARVW